MPRLLGAKLRYLRRQSGMTQVHLAQQLALTAHVHISNLEAGHRTASLDLIVRLADLFGVTTDYLLRDTKPVEAAETFQARRMPGRVGVELFGSKLRYLRLRHNVSQRDLVHRLGLASRAYISNLETGRRTPSPELVLQIADLFEVTTDYLVRDAIPVEPGDVSSDDTVS